MLWRFVKEGRGVKIKKDGEERERKGGEEFEKKRDFGEGDVGSKNKIKRRNKAALPRNERFAK